MYPIIPSHILNGSPPTSSGKVSLTTPTICTKSIWSIWKKCTISSSMSGTQLSDNGAIESSDHRRTHIKTSEAKPSAGSYAMEAIPKDTTSRSFECIDVSEKSSQNRKCFVGIDETGYLLNDQRFSESSWLRRLSLAYDTYSHNAQLEITSDHRLRLRIVKNLVIDEEIQLWFSDDILAILSIPFLTPVNILGKNCYKCIECGKTYESPNPLKIHLATNCDHYKLDDLWLRLNNAIAIKSYMQPTQMNLFRAAAQPIPDTAKLMPALLSERLRGFHPVLTGSESHFHLTGRSPDSIHFPNYNPYHFPHLPPLPSMHPIPLSVSLATPHLQAIATNTSCSYMQRQSPCSTIQTTSTTTAVSASGEKVVAAAAAQLETIVSNMGTSKQGHICIYCGKLYSRKYGLKIHIRTHTGFKPLKCKYCLRPFGDPSNLNKHIRLHVQEKSLYKCHLCSKILVRRRDLLRHMNIKHNISEPNSANGSINGFHDAHSSRSNSVSSDIPCDLSSNDEANADNELNSDDGDDDERIDVD